MSWVDDKIKVRIENNPQSEEFFQIERARMEVAVALMEMREQAGLTQRELAEKSGKLQSTIARIERGTTSASIDTLEKIASVLGKILKISFE
jgi:predicted transcriptional regulator